MKLSKDDRKRLAWLDDHIRGFKEAREIAEKVIAEQEANKRAMLKNEKVAA
jgi:hypothetical protein